MRLSTITEVLPGLLLAYALSENPALAQTSPENNQKIEAADHPKTLSLSEIIEQIDCSIVTKLNDTTDLSDNEVLALIKCNEIKSIDLSMGENLCLAQIHLMNGDVIKREMVIDFGITLQRYLLSKGIDVRTKPLTFSLKDWLPVAIVALLALIVLAATLRINRRSNESKTPETIIERPTIRFADIGGLKNIKRELTEFAEDIKNRKAILEKGGKPSKGILFTGPTGNGKTLTARAIAGETGLPFISVSGSELVSSFMGATASAIRNHFQMAAKLAKDSGACVIFIDEIDAIGARRSQGSSALDKEANGIVNQLLVSMDGFSETDGIIVIAATNHPDILDSALTRPGRFDKQIHFPNPEQEGRLEILRIKTQDIKLAADVRFESIASTLVGKGASVIAHVAEEAKRLAIKRDGDPILTQKDLNTALDRTLLGLESDLVLNKEERERVAFHEAGHTVVGLHDPHSTVERVTIIPRGLALGVTLTPPFAELHLPTRTHLERRLKLLLGGRISELLYLKEGSVGAVDDFRAATKLAKEMVMDFGMPPKDSNLSDVRAYEESTQVDKAVDKLLEDSKSETTALLKANEALVRAIAQRLIDQQTIEHSELMMLVDQHRDKTEV